MDAANIIEKLVKVHEERTIKVIYVSEVMFNELLDDYADGVPARIFHDGVPILMDEKLKGYDVEVVTMNELLKGFDSI